MNLSKSQLIMLRYINNFRANDKLPKYFETLHNLDVEECFKVFWDNQLIEYTPIQQTLSHYTVQQLKELLSTYNLSTSGKKQVLIQRLIDNINESMLMLNLDKYITVTPKGLKTLEMLSDEDYENRCMIRPQLTNEERYNKRFQEAKEQIAQLKKSPVQWMYTFKSMHDLAVCDACKALDGKTFNIQEAIVGVNYPPLKDCTCDFCRCRASHDIVI